jgi:DNA-directed RNA polymerase specialized sigma24 family protein
MQTEAIRPQDERLFREGLTEPQAALFDDWRLYAEAWVERRYKAGKLRDYQAAMSEALLALRRAAASFAGQGQFQPFLDRTLTNAMEDMRLREARLRQVSIDAGNEEDDSAKDGIDPDNLDAMARDRLPCTEDSRVIRERSRKPRKRFRGGLSSVLIEVIKNEAKDAYERGLSVGWKFAWRAALGACGKSNAEIEKLIAEEEERLRREKRNRQQRRRRQRQRLATV